MACLPCSDCSSTTSANYTLPDCINGESCEDIQAADCVVYKGPNLPSIGVSNNDRIKDILIKIYKSLNSTVVTKTYTILVNDSQTSTKVEYLDANETLASSIVAAGNTTTICAIENTPQLMYGTGFLVKGPIVYTSSAGATSNSTTVTVASTTGLVAGQTIFVYSGTGSFPSGTTVSSVTNSTTFVVSQAPTIALTGSNAIIKAYTTGSVTCP